MNIRILHPCVNVCVCVCVCSNGSGWFPTPTQREYLCMMVHVNAHVTPTHLNMLFSTPPHQLCLRMDVHYEGVLTMHAGAVSNAASAGRCRGPKSA